MAENRRKGKRVEDHTAEITAHLSAQMLALTEAVPGLLAMGPNAAQLVTMGKAMFQGALQIPPASPVQASYVQAIRGLAAAVAKGPAPDA
jgi:hypothetical protein